MPQSIASNKIGRVKIGNRPINFRGGDVAAALGTDQIGSIAFYTPGLQPGNYRDATTFEMLPLPLYSALLGVQGVITGTVLQQTAQQGNDAAADVGGSAVWNGFIYSSFPGGANVGKIGKRANLVAVPTLVAGSPVSGGAGFQRGVLSTPSFLLHFSTDAGSACYCRTFSSDVAFTGVNLYANNGTVADIAHTALEVAANTVIFLVVQAGPIYRTINGGGAWAAISGNLSNPAIRVWEGAWLSGATVFMIGQAMAIAQSNDAGATWTVTTGIANTNTLRPPFNNNYNACNGGVALDLINRRGYGNCTDGSLLSWSLDTPTTGYTIESPAGTFTNAQGRLWIQAGYLYHLHETGAATKPGLWAAKLGVPLVWRQVLAPAALTPIWDGGPYTAGFGLDLGEGLVGIECTVQSTKKFVFAFADGVKFFDRYTITDPNLPSGRKPYTRII